MKVENWTRDLLGLNMETVLPRGEFVAWDLPGEIIRQEREFLTYDNWHRIPFLRSKKFQRIVSKVNYSSDRFLKHHGYQQEGGRYRVLKENKEKIAVFCHNGFGLTWLAHLLEIPLPLIWSGFWMAPSSFATVLFDMRSEKWAVPRCIGFCEVSHLHMEGLPVSPHGIKANFD